jgi:hypothetical protein
MWGKQKQMGRWIAIAVAIGMVWASHVSAQRPPKPPKDEPLTYKMVRLSIDRGGTFAINQVIDGAVEVVGYLLDDSGEVSVWKAHYWMVDSTGNIVWSMPLETDPASTHSSARSINNYGVVVGNQRVDEWRQPLLWPDFLSAPINLPLPGDAVGGWAYSINDAGIVVGVMYYPYDPEVEPESNTRIVAWKVDVVIDENGRPTAIAQDPVTILTALRHYPDAQVVNSGFVCASIDVSTDPDVYTERAFRLELGWDQNAVWLEQDSVTQLLDFYSQAYGINEAGSVCGMYFCPTRSKHIAYLKTISDPVVDLPGLPAMKQGGKNWTETNTHRAYALNNATRLQIIGDASRMYTQGNYHGGESGVPLRWEIDASGVRVVDLRTVTDGSPELYSVGDNNDAGWITSCTRSAGGRSESPVLLIPSK